MGNNNGAGQAVSQVVHSGTTHPTSDTVVNQVLGQDQGMLPVVKGGAGAGLRYKDALMFQKCFM